MRPARKVPCRCWAALNFGRRVVTRGVLGLRDALLRAVASRKLRTFTPPYRLHLGCGKVSLPGWVNVDMDPFQSEADFLWNLAGRFPVPDGTVEFIHSEHVLEHFDPADGVAMLRECRRVLRPGGVLRIAMPCLQSLLESSLTPDWRDAAWLQLPEYAFIRTRAEMVNVSFYWWGHRWMYDREELHRRLREAGFQEIRDVEWGHSPEPALSGLETRPESVLICEAIRS